MTLRIGILAGIVLALPAAAAELAPLENFSNTKAGLEIVSPCVLGAPWTVAGLHAALFGRQNGRFEAWQWPVKILSDFRIHAELADYAVPIDVNANAAAIRVTPAETAITYSHAAFTVRQHMFATRTGAAVVFFEIDSVRPLELTFSFTPEMLRMWPAANFGRPNGEWVSTGKSGYYILHTDNEKFSAVVAMPRARPGILVPYQEHPQTYPLEFKLSFDPKKDRGLVFPLLITMRGAGELSELATYLPRLYAETQEYWNHFFDHRLTVETPDARINDGLRWAEVAIEQAQVQTDAGETGMVAGYYESADSARPGYAWFFGRDTLWTTYAINSYGDFALTRRALDFLIKRQRTDGKIMHEYSQAAEMVDWKDTPYFYASADSTTLLVMAMWDYVRTSGDEAYVKDNWPAVKRAYEFTRAHEGNDGIYSNAQGTAWVESWPGGMPPEEIYLAALDQESNAAIARLAELTGDADLAKRASDKARAIATKIDAEYFDAQQSFYAFSRNSDDSLDHTATIYPAVAWWDGGLRLAKPDAMLNRWASSEFSTDWGTRDVSDKTSFYDPISYHQGTVWPLFTGWVSLAEYRAGRPLSGYAHLMHNLNLTWAQDLGSVTELLSGEFFQPLGRSSSHQTWSSAMVVTPLLRGMFGLDWDAASKCLRVSPHLPADWPRASLRHLQLGGTNVDLEMERKAGNLEVQAYTSSAVTLCLTSDATLPKQCAGTPTKLHTLNVPLPPVELAIPAALPAPGSRTAQLKPVSQTPSTFTFEAQGGSTYELPIRLNHAGVTVEGAHIKNGKLLIEFPAGHGYVQKTITFHW